MADQTGKRLLLYLVCISYRGNVVKIESLLFL